MSHTERRRKGLHSNAFAIQLIGVLPRFGTVQYPFHSFAAVLRCPPIWCSPSASQKGLRKEALSSGISAVIDNNAINCRCIGQLLRSSRLVGSCFLASSSSLWTIKDSDSLAVLPRFATKHCAGRNLRCSLSQPPHNHQVNQAS